MSAPARAEGPQHDLRAAVHALSERLGGDAPGEFSLPDLIALAELMASSLQPMLRRVDTTLNKELRGILMRIETLKSDIAKVRADDISANRLPEMGRELDEIVLATEGATNRIMEAAEAVLAAEATDLESYRAMVEDRMMAIFEACSFQDLTGQRVSRIVQTVSVIEERINHLCDMLDMPAGTKTPVALTADEKAKTKRMMHGPAHKGEGVGQAEIDKLF